MGRELEAKIIELDKNRNNVVLSRRAYLEQTQSEVRTNFLQTLQKGQVRTGVVSSIVNFGAFVDLGGRYFQKSCRILRPVCQTRERQ